MNPARWTAGVPFCPIPAICWELPTPKHLRVYTGPAITTFAVGSGEASSLRKAINISSKHVLCFRLNFCRGGAVPAGSYFAVEPLGKGQGYKVSLKHIKTYKTPTDGAKIDFFERFVTWSRVDKTDSNTDAVRCGPELPSTRDLADLVTDVQITQ